MPLPLLALAVASFGIGTTEFVIMGLLPNVAADLRVGIPAAGMLVSGYALGVVVGAPVLAILTSRLPRKTALVALMALFIIGGRSYLQGCWEHRDLARMFLAGGGPPGFELLSRRRYREWTRRNAALLGTDSEWGEALVLVLTTVISEAGHEVAVCEDERAAQRLINNVLGLVEKIGR